MGNPFHADGNLIIPPTTTKGPVIMDGMDNPFVSDGNPGCGRELQGSQLGVQTRTCKQEHWFHEGVKLVQECGVPTQRTYVYVTPGTFPEA